jgi:hypothetical protein
MSRSLMLSLAALAALAVVGSALGSGAVRARLAVRPHTAAPGQTIHVTGTAGTCAPGSAIVAISAAFPGHAYGEGAITGTVRSDHTFSIRGRVSRKAAPGRYDVSARCGGGNLGAGAHLRVS